MQAKYIIPVLLFTFISITGMGMAPSSKKVPQWYTEFCNTYIKINEVYKQDIRINKEYRDNLGFEPLNIDIAKVEKISFSVEKLKYIYISINRNKDQVVWGNFRNPCFIDAQGKRYPISLSNKNVEYGNIGKSIIQGDIDYQFKKAICKLKVESHFVRFEAKPAARKLLFHVDVALDVRAREKANAEFKVLSAKLLPKASGHDGLAQELKYNVSKYLYAENSLQQLNNFYKKNVHNAFMHELSVVEGKNISIEALFQNRRVFLKSQQIKDAENKIKTLDTKAIQEAVEDSKVQFGNRYAKADKYLKIIHTFNSDKAALLGKLEKGDLKVLSKVEYYLNIFSEALLANPILDFDEIVMLQRNANQSRKRMLSSFGYPALNSHNNNKINAIVGPWSNSVVKLSDLRGSKKTETIIDAPDKLISDLELDFNRDHVLFSMENDINRWQVYESTIEGKNTTCLTPDSMPDINHFDACYLPDGNVVFTSDATYQGLPCEGGSYPMALLYHLDRKKDKIRQMTFDQDSDFSPTVMNNGKLMYTRWEYSDQAHYFSRILMSCNPDGTGQMEYYGSNSFFPNTMLYSRPIPNHPTKFVSIISGHHGLSRSGRLMIFDPAKGLSEADGVIQEIPHKGKKVEPVIMDRLVDGVWPQFTHPYPLNDKYFLVSAKPDANSLWGIYLVDVFNNMTLIKEVEGAGLFDPIPVRKEPTPPVIPSRVREDEKEATVFLSDIYMGGGLKNVPKGAVKELRLFAYHFAHISTGGHASVGVESSWDIKRVLGTVPVEADGSAQFKIPANTPIAIQPIDSTGKALQIMRSWFVGMPGENVSCIGCHERKGQTPANMFTLASRRAPSQIKTWQGNVRPFTFRYEVQPILDKNCIACHDGEHKSIPDYRKHEFVDMEGKSKAEFFVDDKAYMNLHPYVRRPGPESDIHMFNPMEYHASTSELVQMLQRGHHGVTLTPKEWEKLYTWIDLNAPYRGQWSPPEFREHDQDERRKCLSKKYANIDVDPEAEYDSLVAYMEKLEVEPIRPKRKARTKFELPTINGWPFTMQEAVNKQKKLSKTSLILDLGKGEQVKLMAIPKGDFIKGNRKGFEDEKKPESITIEKSFFMSECEITNAQFALFDPSHDSRFIDQQWKDHTTPGYAANLPHQPVIRISYDEAIAFCEWMTEKTGKKVTLPNDNQWEWACRAGSDQDFWYGSKANSFGESENLSDDEVRKFAVTGVNPRFIGDNDWKLPYYGFIPRINSVNDGNMITAEVGSYKPNSWGLYDMHGNVAEWTLSSYATTGNDQDQFYNENMKVVKGGSWRDRPKFAKAGSKRYYMPYQKVYNVGFRVVIAE